VVRPVGALSDSAGRGLESIEGRFTSRLHDESVAAWLGIALGTAFSICFATGLITWLVQHPGNWFNWPARPAGLYRIIQGAHVATGIASVPLLLAKLWVVYPRFWSWPPVRNVAHAVERVGLLALVGGSLFLLFSGTANIARWYPWTFSFPLAHYWAAWITMGGLIAHVGAKIHIVRNVVRGEGRGAGALVPVVEGHTGAGGLGRRQFLTAAFGTSAILTVVTVGQTFRPLRRFAFLAPRRPDIGSQGLPVNKTAKGARVTEIAVDPAYRLRVEGDVSAPLVLSLAELRAMPQHEVTLPIACVEGWSATARWRGVRVRDLLAQAGGAPHFSEVGVESLQRKGSYRRCDLPRSHALDHDTLLALEVNGEPLDLDHGYPARLISPNRPGVLQTKWVQALVVKG